MADSGIPTRYLCLPNRSNTPHICIIQGTNKYVDDCARHELNQEEKKTETTELNVFFPKNIRSTKKKNLN